MNNLFSFGAFQPFQSFQSTVGKADMPKAASDLVQLGCTTATECLTSQRDIHAKLTDMQIRQINAMAEGDTQAMQKAANLPVTLGLLVADEVRLANERLISRTISFLEAHGNGVSFAPVTQAIDAVNKAAQKTLESIAASLPTEPAGERKGTAKAKAA